MKPSHARRNILVKDFAAVVPRKPRQVAFSKGERDLFQFYRTNRRQTVGLTELADRLGVSRRGLYRATRRLPFVRTFGPDIAGAPMAVYFVDDLRRWSRIPRNAERALISEGPAR